MEKIIIASASYYNQKYYINSMFADLPTNVRNELRRICIPLAEKLCCVFTIGLYTNGSFFIEAKADENDYNYDEIGAALEIKNIEKNQKQLIQSLQKWYYLKNNANVKDNDSMDKTDSNRFEG